MVKTFTVCIVIIAMLTGLCISIAAEEQSGVTGEWRGFYTGTGGERLDFWLTLKQDGEEVTGRFLNQSVRPPADVPGSGSFKDGVLQLARPSGFRGSVSGNTMTGTFSSRVGVAVNFTATRTK